MKKKKTKFIVMTEVFKTSSSCLSLYTALETVFALCFCAFSITVIHGICTLFALYIIVTVSRFCAAFCAYVRFKSMIYF